jgi:hypothetical protein
MLDGDWSSDVCSSDLLERASPSAFDAEEYRILQKAIKAGKLEVLPLAPGHERGLSG